MKIIKLLSLIFIVFIILNSCTVNSHIMLKTPRNYVFKELDPNKNKEEYKIAINDLMSFQLFTNNGFQLIDMFNQNNNIINKVEQ